MKNGARGDGCRTPSHARPILAMDDATGSVPGDEVRGEPRRLPCIGLQGREPLQGILARTADNPPAQSQGQCLVAVCQPFGLPANATADRGEDMTTRKSRHRSWAWAFVGVQLVGVAWDAVSSRGQTEQRLVGYSEMADRQKGMHTLLTIA
jgi:hypothetical protein